MSSLRPKPQLLSSKTWPESQTQIALKVSISECPGGSRQLPIQHRLRHARRLFAPLRDTKGGPAFSALCRGFEGRSTHEPLSPGAVTYCSIPKALNAKL